jgi:hypothetical protein
MTEQPNRSGPTRRGDAPPESRASKLRSVAVTGMVAAAMLGAMYGVTLHRVAKEAEQHQAKMQYEASLAAQHPPG